MWLWAILVAGVAVAGDLPPGEGRETIDNKCSRCHKPESITEYQHTPDEWRGTVYRMWTRAGLASEEAETLIGYLSKNFPKVDDPNKVNVNYAPAKELHERLELTQSEADAVVAYREKHGNFHQWGDLLVIYGLDGKKIEAAKDKISF